MENMEVGKAKGGRIPILNWIKKVPGGLLLVPMVIVAIINTFCPNLVKIGGATEFLFTNTCTMYVVGLMLFFSGTQCMLSQVKEMVKIGGLLCVIKIGIMAAGCIVVQKVCGLDGFWGISLVTFVAVLASTNPGLYMALTSENPTALSVFSLLNLLVMPAIPVMALNLASGYAMDWNSVISILIPFFIGMVLGNLDDEIRKMFQSGCTIVLPFMGFCLGGSINLIAAVKAGLGGLLCAVLFYVLTWIPLYWAEKRILKREGLVATAMSAIASFTATVPGIAAAANPVFEPYVETAVAQIALASLLTCLVTPVLVGRIERKIQK